MGSSLESAWVIFAETWFPEGQNLPASHTRPKRTLSLHKNGEGRLSALSSHKSACSDERERLKEDLKAGDRAIPLFRSVLRWEGISSGDAYRAGDDNLIASAQSHAWWNIGTSEPAPRPVNSSGICHTTGKCQGGDLTEVRACALLSILRQKFQIAVCSQGKEVHRKWQESKSPMFSDPFNYFK